MIHKAQENGLVKGLVSDYIEHGLAVLQYADDTILCLEEDTESVQNMKLLLCIYEKMSGLKINFNKSEVLMISQDWEKAIFYAEIMNCATGEWPIKYLGVPVTSSKLHIADWMPVDEKLLKRLDGWKGNALSLGGRHILINSCLSSIPTYYMSMHMLPKTILKKMDRTRKRFFWQGGGEKRKYYLVKWDKITRPKQKGGLGIKDLRKMNISLLCKWWWKLEHEGGLWQEIVRKKYKIRRGITQLQKNPRNSSVWNDLLKVKALYLSGRTMLVGNGQDTDFWEDAWCGVVPLKEKFTELFEICTEQNKSVAEMANRGWRMGFRRWLDESAQGQLRQLRDILGACALSDERDKARWTLEKSGIFTVKSMYRFLFSWEVNSPNKKLWKSRIPLKVKIFMWLIQENAILTKDNLIKRNWQGDRRCYFCNSDENIDHLFFDCHLARYIWSLISYVVGADCRPTSFLQFWIWVNKFITNNKVIHFAGLSAICWAIWKVRNKVYFDKKPVLSPTEIVCVASSFISYWAGLHKEGDKQALEIGAEAMKNAALLFHPVQDEGATGDGTVLLN
jgi:hypothetical protein